MGSLLLGKEPILDHLVLEKMVFDIFFDFLHQDQHRLVNPKVDQTHFFWLKDLEVFDFLEDLEVQGLSAAAAFDGHLSRPLLMFCLQDKATPEMGQS